MLFPAPLRHLDAATAMNGSQRAYGSGLSTPRGSPLPPLICHLTPLTKAVLAATVGPAWRNIPLTASEGTWVALPSRLYIIAHESRSPCERADTICQEIASSLGNFFHVLSMYPDDTTISIFTNHITPRILDTFWNMVLARKYEICPGI